MIMAQKTLTTSYLAQLTNARSNLFACHRRDARITTA